MCGSTCRAPASNPAWKRQRFVRFRVVDQDVMAIRVLGGVVPEVTGVVDDHGGATIDGALERDVVERPRLLHPKLQLLSGPLGVSVDERPDHGGRPVGDHGDVRRSSPLHGEREGGRDGGEERDGCEQGPQPGAGTAA
jgi:hypothetical protein